MVKRRERGFLGLLEISFICYTRFIVGLMNKNSLQEMLLLVTIFLGGKLKFVTKSNLLVTKTANSSLKTSNAQ